MEFQIQSRILLWALPAVFCLGGCKKPAKDPSPAEKIRKVWVADRVTENNTIVYERDGSTAIRNYSSYRLDLSSPPSVTLKEVDGSTLTGQYEVTSDKQLILSGLQPVPTGTDGSITYSFTFDDDALELRQVASNLKTGNSKNTYRLVNP